MRRTTPNQQSLHDWLSAVPRTPAQNDGGPAALQLAGGQTEIGSSKDLFFLQRGQKCVFTQGSNPDHDVPVECRNRMNNVGQYLC